MNAALTLQTLPWSESEAGGGKIEKIEPRITLIDKSERFVFLPLLYELCVDDASVDEVAPTFRSLLNGAAGGGGLALPSGLPDLSRALQLLSGEQAAETRVNRCEVSFLRANVEGIDVQNRQVIVSKTASDEGALETIDYDALVVATGSEISLDAIPGASDYALPFYTVEQALELKRRLALLDAYYDDVSGGKENEEELSIVVVGGGYSGVELALNLVDRFDSSDDGAARVRVSLVHRGERVLEYATEHNRNAGTERLEKAGVNVMTSTSVLKVLPYDGDETDEMSALMRQRCELKLSTKSKDGAGEEGKITSQPATLLLWTAGAVPTPEGNTGIRNSVLPRDVMGRILTSPTLNVPSHPEVFSVGDCSRPRRVPYPGTAQVAMQMATVAAWNVYATLAYRSSPTGDRRDSKLLPFKFLNLGEMMTLGTDDATISTLGGLVELNGPAASWLRRWIYAARMPTTKQGLVAAADGTARKVARGAAAARRRRSSRRKSKPVDWK